MAAVIVGGVGLGKGNMEHAGARDVSRKHGHWGFTGEAKVWATRARRRDEREVLRDELAEADQPAPPNGQADPSSDTGDQPTSWVQRFR